jgi:hypothetical protein
MHKVFYGLFTLNYSSANRTFCAIGTDKYTQLDSY